MSTDENARPDDPTSATVPSTELPTTGLPATEPPTAAYPTSAYPTAAQPSATYAATADPVRPVQPAASVAPSGPRVGTVVWGLVLVALGTGVVGVAGGARLDLGLAAIVLLAGAGVALLAGSLVSALRRDRGRA